MCEILCLQLNCKGVYLDALHLFPFAYVSFLRAVFTSADNVDGYQNYVIVEGIQYKSQYQ